MIAGVVSYMLLCWGEGGVVFAGWLVFLCVRRLGAFGFLWEREQVCEM